MTSHRQQAARHADLLRHDIDAVRQLGPKQVDGFYRRALQHRWSPDDLTTLSVVTRLAARAGLAAAALERARAEEATT